jgi:protein-L-isoaspartate(D-aspartate) O-methyltransferase
MWYEANEGRAFRGLLLAGLLLAGLLLLALASSCGPSQLPPPAPPTQTGTPMAAPTPTPLPSASATVSPTGTGTATPEVADPFTIERAAMVRNQIEARGVRDPAVLTVMRRVPRHRFVPTEYLDAAYEDHPLPIGYGQTISQPYIVALMTEALKIKPGSRVLEIGTGSGYQAAILAELDAEVYTVEIIPALAQEAEQRLRDLGYGKVRVLNADGYFGWPEHAPFDAIIVTAAPDHLPQPLANQLKEGGRLIIPIGPQGSFQTLWLFEKKNGELAATNLGGVIFVPLTGEH